MRLAHLRRGAKSRAAWGHPKAVSIGAVPKHPTAFLSLTTLRLCLLSGLFVLLWGCDAASTLGKTQPGAGAVAADLWQRWVASGGDVAVATTWERKVQPGVTASDVEQVLMQVAAERNMKDVGQLPLSKELEARTGQPQKLLKVYSFCNPTTARAMVDFSPHMAAYLPCRITLVERGDGLWLYTLNMDMMLKLGRTLPPGLQEEAQSVRDTLHQMLERASRGEI